MAALRRGSVSAVDFLVRGAERRGGACARSFATARDDADEGHEGEPASSRGGERIPMLSFEELFFLHNSSLPGLKDRVFRGKVVASDKRSVYVDIGLHRLVRFPPYELKRSKYAVELHDNSEGGSEPEADQGDEERMIESNIQKKLVKAGFDLDQPSQSGEKVDPKDQAAVSSVRAYDSQSDEVDRKLAEQRATRDALEHKRALKRKEKLRVGDHVDLDVHYFSAYDGTITVEPLDTPSLSTTEAVWNELQSASDTERPVPGRILNKVNKGYAVGIAGIVAFLPESFALDRRVSQVGVLQWFQIISLERETNNILVRCAKVS